MKTLQDKLLRYVQIWGDRPPMMVMIGSLDEGLALKEWMESTLSFKVDFVFKDGSPESLKEADRLNNQCDFLSAHGLTLLLVCAKPNLVFGTPDLRSRASHQGYIVGKEI